MTEKNQQLLQELEKEGVKFLPWIGDKYEDGIYYDEEGELRYGNNKEKNNKGKKVLVLGESFYWDDEDDGNAKMFVHELIEDFIDPQSEFLPYKRTFIKFERAMAGRELNKEKSKEFWEHVMFYNYVQEPLRGTRMSPTAEQFGKAAGLFYSLLKSCRPNLVIAWGNRLYNNLPSKGVIKGNVGKFVEVEDNFYETWNYDIEEKVVSVLGIYHPSAAFDWGYWHQVIIKFFDYGK